MGYDYALVHLHYTIPPAVVLTFLYQPLLTTLGIYKILFLVTIAVVSTSPWDSYLINTRIWSYPPNTIVGPTLFRIPAEEVFFFIIQTYNTSLLYLIVSKPTFHTAFLRSQRLLNNGGRLRQWRWVGTGIILTAIVCGVASVRRRGEGLYMGLIIVWAGPFVLLLWSLAYQFILNLPISNTLIPIALPTIYLWIVDTLALKRGTWVIESGTKLGWHLWDGLEIEEAVFFLVTNVLIVFGLIAFDNAFAILATFPALFPRVPPLPSPVLLVRALLIPTSAYDQDRLEGLQMALARLKAKSRSFYLASGAFEGRLRIDLILLYSFCRIADDLVDEAKDVQEARKWIGRLNEYLDIVYHDGFMDKAKSRHQFIKTKFPPSVQTELTLLPATYLSPEPLYDLIKGFETDLHFSISDDSFPIKDEASLELYGARVAGTVAEACIELVFYHSKTKLADQQRLHIVEAGGRMGVALQYINIARDIAVDAANGRVYLPLTWLKEKGIGPKFVLQAPGDQAVERLRQHLLDKAMLIYEEARAAIEDLPSEARGPMRVAVESYVEIGRVLQEPGYRLKAGRATVSKARRLKVAWKALSRR